MSPRAACRLEQLGFEVWDYVTGKADWIGAGLPTEGHDHPERVGAVMQPPPPTCRVDDDVADVKARLEHEGRDLAAVVSDSGIVVGRVRLKKLGVDAQGPVSDVMEPGPTTARPLEEAEENRARMRKHHVDSMLVTTPEGLLLGELRVS